MSIPIIHGAIGLVSLSAAFGTYKIKSSSYYWLAVVLTALMVISGFAIKFIGKTTWLRIAMETTATALVYGLILYKNAPKA